MSTERKWDPAGIKKQAVRVGSTCYVKILAPYLYRNMGFWCFDIGLSVVEYWGQMDWISVHQVWVSIDVRLDQLPIP